MCITWLDSKGVPISRRTHSFCYGVEEKYGSCLFSRQNVQFPWAVDLGRTRRLHLNGKHYLTTQSQLAFDDNIWCDKYLFIVDSSGQLISAVFSGVCIGSRSTSVHKFNIVRGICSVYPKILAAIFPKAVLLPCDFTLEHLSPTKFVLLHCFVFFQLYIQLLPSYDVLNFLTYLETAKALCRFKKCLYNYITVNIFIIIAFLHYLNAYLNYRGSFSMDAHGIYNNTGNLTVSMMHPLFQTIHHPVRSFGSGTLSHCY